MSELVAFGQEEIEALANRLAGARAYQDEYSCGWRVTRYFNLGPEDVKLAAKLLAAIAREHKAKAAA